MFKTPKYWNMSKKQIREFLDKDVFSNQEFQNHIQEVSNLLDIDEHIVRKVMKHYIINIHYMINRFNRKDYKINISGFLQLIVKRSRF